MGGRKPSVQLERLRELYVDQGLTIDEVAKRTGINRSGVSARLKKAKVKMRPRGSGRRARKAAP